MTQVESMWVGLIWVGLVQLGLVYLRLGYLGLVQVGLLGFGLLGLRVSLKSFPGLWPVWQSPPFKFSSIRSSWVAWGCVGLRGVGLRWSAE